MFGLDWSELAIIAVIALVVVGPKDLPKMMRAAGQSAARLRRLADEFRGQMTEALRESDMDDLRKSVDDLRSLDPRSMIRQEVAKLAEPVKALAEDVRNEIGDAQGRAAAAVAATPAIPDASPTPAIPTPATPLAADLDAAIDLVLPEPAVLVGPPEFPPPEFVPPEIVPPVGLPAALEPIDLGPPVAVPAAPVAALPVATPPVTAPVVKAGLISPPLAGPLPAAVVAPAPHTTAPPEDSGSHR